MTVYSDLDGRNRNHGPLGGYVLRSVEHPALALCVKARLEQRQSELVTQLANGFAQDWPDYRFRVGQISGIEAAIAFCDEVERELNGEENSNGRSRQTT